MWKLIGPIEKKHSQVRIQTGGIFRVGKNVRIQKSTIYVDSTSELILDSHVQLIGVKIFVTKGSHVHISEYSCLSQGNNIACPLYTISQGKLIVDHHVYLRLQRLWIRFGGFIHIGQYTNINNGSEIRSDERVEIGSYCMLSYNLRIWDTNTHCIYPSEKEEN